MVKYLDDIIYWLIICIPFSMAVAPAPMNVFMGILIAAFLAKKLAKKESISVKNTLRTPLLFLFIITCLSVFNSVDLKDSLKGGILRLLQYILIFFIVAQDLRDKKHINKVIFSIVLGAVFVSFDGIWQVLTGKDFVRGYGPVINIGLTRATASFKDSNMLGIYLSALAPLIFGLALYYLRGIKKMLFVCAGAIALIGIVLTYSRPTLLAVYIVLFFFAIAKKDKFLIVLLAGFALISPFILPQSVKEWAREVEYNPLRFMCNDDRIAVYRNSINMIKAHPIIGVGANAYMKSYKRYKEFPEYRNIITLDEMKAHNNFFQMAAEIGLVGFGIFIWMLYKLFAKSKYIYQRLNDRYLRIVSLSLIACLIAFLVNGLTESSLYYSRVAMLFWYLAGFSLSLEKFIDADKQRRN